MKTVTTNGVTQGKRIMAVINIDFAEPLAHILIYKKPAWHHGKEFKLVIVSILSLFLMQGHMRGHFLCILGGIWTFWGSYILQLKTWTVF